MKKFFDPSIQQCEVELEFAREVLVEHRLRDPGGVGNLVHTGGVIAPVHEDLARLRHDLLAPLLARHPGPLRAGSLRGHRSVVSSIGHPFRLAPERRTLVV